nr:hypothetical protein [Mycobacterium sp. E2479]
MPQLATGLLREPRPQSRLRGHRHGADRPRAAQHAAAAEHVAVDASAAHHSAAAEHVAVDAAAHHGATAEHMAVDAAAAHDASAQHAAAGLEHVAAAAEQYDGPDADAMPQLGQKLHAGARPQPEFRLWGLGYDAAEQHPAQLLAAGAEQHAAEFLAGTGERLDVTDADGVSRLVQELHPGPQPRTRLRGLGLHAAERRTVGRRDPDHGGTVGRYYQPAGRAQFIPAQAAAPNPQRALDPASSPAVLPAAPAHPTTHWRDWRPHQRAGWWLLGPGPGSATTAATEWLRVEQWPGPWRAPAQLGRPAARGWLERAAACRWLEPTLAGGTG